MAVNPHLATTVPAGTAYWRITSQAFNTRSATQHRKVVSGQGAFFNPHGARYNYPGAASVYLAESPDTALAEKMFYFHRDVLQGIDQLHIHGALPPFAQTFILWEIEFAAGVPDVFDLSPANAPAAGVFPSLMLNPSQDYWHLKQCRAAIQSAGYRGIRAPSSRDRSGGNMVVVFGDQSRNVRSIVPHPVTFRLLTTATLPAPFTNHATELMDFTTGEVMFPGAPVLGSSRRAGWARVDFNH